MKFQNSIYLILIGLSIISCGNDTINLDYGKLEFPEHEVIDEAILDEIKQNQNRLNELSDQDGVHCKTDKDVYHYGETIGLTIENNTSDPVYFFPDDTEGLRSYYVYNLQSDKEYYREYLVSENPGFLGNITYHDPYTVYLHFSGVDKLTANELNINRFTLFLLMALFL
jgi:hypothetical protein